MAKFLHPDFFANPLSFSLKVVKLYFTLILALGIHSSALGQMYGDMYLTDGTVIEDRKFTKEKGMAIVKYKDEYDEIQYIPLDSIEQIYDARKNKRIFYLNEKYRDRLENIPFEKAKELQRQSKLKELLMVGVLFDNISFPSGKFNIPSGEYKKINKVAAFLEEWPEIKINILGHTDTVGKAEKNLELSFNRAKAVSEYLIDELGIKEIRITYDGKGETRPIGTNEQNRRVEFQVNYDGVMVEYYTDKELSDAKIFINNVSAPIVIQDVNAPINITGNGGNGEGTAVTNEGRVSLPVLETDTLKGVASLFTKDRDIYQYWGVGSGILRTGPAYNQDGFTPSGRFLPICVFWERTNLTDRLLDVDWWASGGYVNYVNNTYNDKAIKSNFLSIGWRNTFLLSEMTNDIFGKAIIPQQLEFYAGAHIGFMLNLNYDEFTQPEGKFEIVPYAGARYYFYKQFGAFAEVGRTAQSVFTVGLTARIRKATAKANNPIRNFRPFLGGANNNTPTNNNPPAQPNERQTPPNVENPAAPNVANTQVPTENTSPQEENTPANQAPNYAAPTKPKEGKKRLGGVGWFVHGGVSFVDVKGGNYVVSLTGNNPVDLDSTTMVGTIGVGLDFKFPFGLVIQTDVELPIGQIGGLYWSNYLGYRIGKRFNVTPSVGYTIGRMGKSIGTIQDNFNGYLIDGEEIYGPIDIRLRNFLGNFQAKLDIGIPLGKRVSLRLSGGYSLPVAKGKRVVAYDGYSESSTDLGDDGVRSTKTVNRGEDKFTLTRNGNLFNENFALKQGIFGTLGIHFHF